MVTLEDYRDLYKIDATEREMLKTLYYTALRHLKKKQVVLIQISEAHTVP
jgi:hypothetical protein